MSDSKSYRIRTNVLDDSDKYLRMKLDQDFDQLDVLSLSISQQQAYESFCSDYGAVVGRVVVNRGFGVPNVRVSIFVPLQDEDRDNEEIRDLYPFEQPTDKNENGIRYNLLPKNRQYDCHTPLGSMPSKREILDNDTMIEVYEKYYRYSTVTNSAGDFMIFGVPVGYHTIHMDADLSDIGYLSIKPYHFIAEGRDPNEFASPNKFRETSNLNNAVHIESRDKGITVRPFWGDTDNCEVGISRLDFTLSHELKTYALFMGSVFTDNDKNSVNKNCRPRRKMGNMCEVATSEGTVEMIRKTPQGTVEDFNVEGGRVIDENGAWSYLVPLNLDAVVTDEFGNQVPSEDPDIGLSTRASVRFKIGMDVVGGEGRLRKRAKYLVPHNPDTYFDSDYSFGQGTSDQHFKDLHWNKLYTVSNHIPRYQGNRGVFIINNRNFVGVKDVDGCPATNNPFPFNRINPKFIPLFNILCVIFTIITFLVWFLNAVLIPIINLIIKAIRKVIEIINNIIGTIEDIVCQCWKIGKPINIKILCCSFTGDDGNAIPKPSFVKCVDVGCGDNTTYVPGCSEGSEGWDAIGGGGGGNNTLNNNRKDLMQCLETQLADSLNLYEFDFYNDWVNGTLYHFLYKYKVRDGDGGKTKPKLCAYNCADFSDNFSNDDDYVDSGTGANQYNNCKGANSIADTCDEGSATDTTYTEFTDGAIMFTKDGEMFYPPITHGGEQKLFASDIINLGSFIDCDPDGSPSIMEGLSPTSYKLPPLFTQYQAFDGDSDPAITGMQPLFFNLDCIKGLTTEVYHCTNHKRLCEIDVDVDEVDTDNTNQPDGCINEPDMSDNRLGRDVITYYASNSDDQAFSGPIDSTIGDSCNGYFTLWVDNGGDYQNYRELTDPGSEKPNYFERSYYFYFGLKPGATAYEKTISKFFDSCDPSDENRLIIELENLTNVTTLGASDGAIDITVLNGTADYDYSWSGPNGYSSTIKNKNASNGDISGIEPGFYTVNVIDSEGSKGSATFQVKGPPPLSCFHEIVQQPTHENADDGQLLITVNNGSPDYTIEIGDTNGNIIKDETISGNDYTFSGLSADSYNYYVTDSSSPSQECSGTTTITAPPELEVTATTKDVSCFNKNDGEVSLEFDGSAPVSVTAETTNNNTYYQENGTTYSGLDGGATSTNPDSFDYTITVKDATGQKVQKVVTINEPSKLRFDTLNIEHMFCHDYPSGEITFQMAGGNPDYNADIDKNGNDFSTYSGFDDSTTINETGLIDGNYQIDITDSSGCTENTGFTIFNPDPIEIADITADASNGEVRITAGGGNPVSPINQGTYAFRISECECLENSDPNPCSPITPSNSGGLISDDYHYGDGGSGDQLTLVDGSDFDNSCDDDNNNVFEHSFVYKIEIMDTRALNELGGQSCGGLGECVATEHIVVEYDSNGNMTGTYDNVDNGNLDEC